MKCVSIAIDGPAGAGKSTLARKTARELGFLYVDTGAIYRTVALKVLRAGADPTEESQVIPLLNGLDISMDYGPDGEQRMFLEGEDVSKAIREHQISGLASKVSAIPAVRDFLLEFQRTQAREHNGHGRPGYRNRRAASGRCENISHCGTGVPCPPPSLGAGRAGAKD